jgi:hypothetical protein
MREKERVSMVDVCGGFERERGYGKVESAKAGDGSR